VIEDTVLVENSAGLHARSARVIVDSVSDFDCSMTIRNGHTTASADSILELMMLTAHAGTELKIEVEGPEAEAALDRTRELFRNGFDPA
jgi:phosphotransferase system HPr (HPr) family protein